MAVPFNSGSMLMPQWSGFRASSYEKCGILSNTVLVTSKSTQCPLRCSAAPHAAGNDVTVKQERQDDSSAVINELNPLVASLKVSRTAALTDAARAMQVSKRRGRDQKS